MFRHIAWFNEARIEPAADGRLTSPDPVVVRRCLIPAVELEERGIDCSVFGNMQNANPTQVALHLQKLNTDIVVIGHLSGPSAYTLARMAKHCGCLVVIDIGYATEGLEDVEHLKEIADHFVAATPDVAAEIFTLIHQPATVIPDCHEETGITHAPEEIVQRWFLCFQSLKPKPPPCANMNEPTGT